MVKTRDAESSPVLPAEVWTLEVYANDGEMDGGTDEIPAELSPAPATPKPSSTLSTIVLIRFEFV